MLLKLEAYLAKMHGSAFTHDGSIPILHFVIFDLIVLGNKFALLRNFGFPNPSEYWLVKDGLILSTHKQSGNNSFPSLCCGCFLVLNVNAHYLEDVENIELLIDSLVLTMQHTPLQENSITPTTLLKDFHHSATSS